MYVGSALSSMITLQFWLYSLPANTLHSYSHNSDICHIADDTFYFPLISVCVHVVSLHVTTASFSRPTLNMWQTRPCFSAGYMINIGEERSWYNQTEGLTTKLYTIYVCMYVCTYVCMYVCMYVCIYVYMYVCMYVYMYVCMYVWPYVRMSECTHKHTHSNAQARTNAHNHKHNLNSRLHYF